MSFESKSLGFPLQFAQSTGESAPQDVANPGLEPNAIALSDNTRLGPYSVLLKDAFEESQSEQSLQLNESENSSDLVAIARSLTPAEQSQGLQQQLVTREKIALIVGADNPFQGTLTLEQVTQILQGEITNWQQLGGEDRPLKVVNRASSNQTRQAFESYFVFDPAKFDENSIAEGQDTTSDVVEALGKTGISYTPASEAIEQFNMRIITIDNVGVDDGRYPFSQPLHYVYATPPSQPVKGFLDFLATPDAQSAIEFAQSQPADPTRAYTSPSLAVLQETPTQTPNQPSPSKDSPSTQSDAIPAMPLEGVPNSPEIESTIPALPSPGSGGDIWSGLPLLLMFLSLGILGWLALMRVQLEKKRKKVVRPAPNYAERIKGQGSNRDMNDLKALVRTPEQGESEDLTDSDPVVPDLSLAPKPNEANLTEGTIESDLPLVDNPSSEVDDPVWDDDVTTLQAAPLPELDLAEEEDKHKILQQVSDESIVSSSTLELNEDLTTLQGIDLESDEDLTTLQRAAPLSSDESNLSDSVTQDSEDVTLVQGVFPPGAIHAKEAADDLEDLTDPSGLLIDPLTGRVIEEDESDSAGEQNASEDGADDESENTDSSEIGWKQIADPWE